jgi:predicted RNA-binding Zn-ribbon protein involved in translation (DUF1610 family)
MRWNFNCEKCGTESSNDPIEVKRILDKARKKTNLTTVVYVCPWCAESFRILDREIINKMLEVEKSV